MSGHRPSPLPGTPRTVADFRPFWPRTAMEAHGMELLEVDENHAVVAMPVTDATRQPLGMLHGGATMLLVETAASVHACWGVDLAQRVPVGVEISGSHVRSCSGGRVRATATVVRRTHSLIVHTVEVVHEESGERLSSCRVTNFYKQTGSPPSPAEAKAAPVRRSPRC